MAPSDGVVEPVCVGRDAILSAQHVDRECVEACLRGERLPSYQQHVDRGWLKPVCVGRDCHLISSTWTVGAREAYKRERWPRGALHSLSLTMFFVSLDNFTCYLSGFLAWNGKAYFLASDVGCLLAPTDEERQKELVERIGNCQVKDVCHFRMAYIDPDEWIVEYRALLHYLEWSVQKEGGPHHTKLLIFLESDTVRRQDHVDPNNPLVVYFEQDAESQVTFSSWLNGQLNWLKEELRREQQQQQQA